MKRGQGVLLVSCWCAAHACVGDHPRPGRWHDEPPALAVVLRGDSRTALVSVTVEAVPAPDIEFPALVRPDPNHITVVFSPVSGTLGRISDQHHARRAETLAVVEQRLERTAREVGVAGPHDGAWRPRRRQGQLVWEGDTLGLLEQHGYWLAVGSVRDFEAPLIHAGDPASVRFGADRHFARPARVESVRGPGRNSPYSADVAVEFRAPHSAPPSQVGAVTVVVSPVHPTDSLPAVPARAVVQLPPGPAVFVPVGDGRFEVRWVSPGPSVDGLVVLRGGVRPGMSVVASGLAPLAEAARDSLARHPGKP